MKTKRDQPEKNLTIRLPERLLQQLRESAVNNERSLNSEVVYILNQAMKAHEGK
jgi:hypothetical protein